MKIVIVKYVGGNCRSIELALKRLGVETIVSDNPEIIEGADKVVFPGVGQATSAMQSIIKTGIDQVLCNLKQPYLGICLGMQLLGKYSAENNTKCLGLVDLDVSRFESQEIKIPHVGWNQIYDLKGPLYQGIKQAYVYFVHSYKFPSNSWENASCDYAQKFCAGLQFRNYYAVQFHPERSGEVGAKILSNFIEL